MKTKILLTSALVAGFASSAAAHGTPTITLGGYIDTQVGFRNQDGIYEHRLLDTANSDKLHKYALVNDTKLFVNVDGHMRNGMKYGGMVTLNADTSDRKTTADKVGFLGSRQGYEPGYNAYRVMTYVEGGFGRAEAGATTGVYDAMHTNAGSIARATGGVDGDSRYWWHPEISSTGVNLVHNNFITRPALPSAYDTDFQAHANKFNYMTPSFKGFRAGVTYVPDTEVSGTISRATGITKDVRATLINRVGYTDVWSGALTWDGQYRQVGMNVALTGEVGEAKNTPSFTPGTRHDLQAWEAGGSLSYMNFTLAGSYADWDDSGAIKASTGKQKAGYWNVGGSFVHGPFGASVTYLASKRGVDTNQVAIGSAVLVNGRGRTEFSNLSFGVDYKLAPGLMPYAEVSVFDIDNKDGTSVNKNDGTIFLIGSKLSF